MTPKNVDWGKWKKSSAPFMEVLGEYQLNMMLELCKGPRILDIGCGDGVITEELGKRFEEVIGIDEAKAQINHARENFKNAKFILSSVEDFDSEGKLFDSVISIEVLEHVDNPVFVLKKMKSFVKEGGYLIVMVPNALALNRRIGESMGLVKDIRMTPHDIEVGHQRMYDMNDLRKDVIEAGLEVKDIGGFFLKPLSNKQMRWLLDKGVWENEDQKDKYLDALFEMGKKIPEYSTILYARCILK